MKALYSQSKNGQVITEIREVPDPTPRDGEVKVKVEYSSLNYKDALAVTSVGSIFKKFPIIGGIDVAGEIVETRSSKFKVGDPVLVTGCGLGETHDGGYAKFVIELDQNVVLRNSQGDEATALTSRQAMIFGTAGFTAELALARMLQNGQKPEMGPVLVTGASGGVGQFAIRAFSRAGFEVHALTGKPEVHERLTKLGAKKIVRSDEFWSMSAAPDSSTRSVRPLESVQYGGAVDNLGGKTLAAIIARTQLWGSVASIGLAENAELHTTVMPMVLRGVSLLGISSNNCAYDLRLKLWRKLAAEAANNQREMFDLDTFVTREISLDQVLDVAKAMLSRQTYGRILVKI